MNINCNFCKGWNFINDNNIIICKDCGNLLTYFNWNWYNDKLEIVKKIWYSRLTYVIYLINNINLHYIVYSDELNNMYEKIKDNIQFDYQINKKYIKLNKINCWYHNIYYFMYLKYKDKYKFINNDTKNLIITMFKKYENVYKENKRYIKLKKKFLNYQYILYNIFIRLDLYDDYYNYIDLPNDIIIIKLNEIWSKFFI